MNSPPDPETLQAPRVAAAFFDRLEQDTRAEAAALMRIPFVQAAVAGALSREAYVAFLGQAYHHVRQTVPLLMATGAALPVHHQHLRDAVCDYIAEERGHEAWILADIEACGGDPRRARDTPPELPCELMVAYARDLIAHGNPVGFFGMVHVLEGTSVRAATAAAEALGASLGLPPEAFTYLTSHGSLDIEHVRMFSELMNGLQDEADRAAVVSAARRFFRLYGDIFRSLSLR